jgi:hypothetical protein
MGLMEGVDGRVNTTYTVKITHEDDWWLARVTGASEGADTSPLNALTQARTADSAEEMARDLIATILDAEEQEFDIRFEKTIRKPSQHDH